MITNNLLFSVLIAQYNNAKFLQEAINSVKAQIYSNWKIIITNDVSTNNAIQS
jgi:glycosyltransferase involved in cell wall biosynthesis